MNTAIEIERGYDVEQIRENFPVLTRRVQQQPLVYLDNAATTQKPVAVIEALTHYYGTYNANIHRGIHALADEATAAFESTRDLVRDFICAHHREEIIFTSGTTDAINLVAYTWARKNISRGDEIIISGMEHHSNIVPWQIVCEEKGAILKVIPILEDGALDMQAYLQLLSNRTKLVSIAHASNALGTINPVGEMIAAAHKAGAKVLLDGAQSAVHLDIDVQALDCDFFAFSGHKVYGPTGIGILYGKMELLEAMPPFRGGGEMIKEVTFEKTTYNDLPYKFEAGTPNIAGAIALKNALDFVNETGKELIRNHERQLLDYATNALSEIPGLRIVGQAPDKVSLVSFVIEKLHPQDIGVLLNNQGIAVRTGHHCTQPLMSRFRIPGTVRASLAMYNTAEEIDALVLGLHKAIKMLS